MDKSLNNRFSDKNFNFIISHLLLIIPPILFIYGYLGDGFIFANGEMFKFMNPGYINYFSTWQDNFNFGASEVYNSNIALYYIFWSILEFFDFIAHPSVQYVFLAYYLPALTMYALLKYIFPGKSIAILALAALTYNFSIWRIPTGMTYDTVNVLFIFLPVLVHTYMKLLDTQQYKYVFALIIVAFLSSTMANNLPVLLVAYWIMFFYFLFKLKQNWRDKKYIYTSIGQNILLVVLLILVNLFWIVDLLSHLLAFKHSVEEGTQGLWTNLKSGHMFDYFRYFGRWAWYIKDYYDYNSYYYNFFTILISYSFVLLVLLGFLIRNKQKVNYPLIVLFKFVFIFGILFSLGAKTITSNLFMGLYENTLLFSIYREPFQKFMPFAIFAGSILLAHTLIFLLQDHKRKLLYVFALYLAYNVLLFPVYNQNVLPIQKYNNGIAGQIVKIPDYWHELKEFLDKRKQFDNIVLSPKLHESTSHLLEYGSSTQLNLFELFIVKNVLKDYDHIRSDSDLMTRKLYEKNVNFQKHLGFLNAELLLQMNDVEFRTSPYINDPTRQKEILERHDFNILRHFGKFTKEYLDKIPNSKDPGQRNYFYQQLLDRPILTLYKVDDKYYYPRIYRTTKIYIMNAEVNNMPYIVSEMDDSTNNSFVFTNQNQDISDILDMEYEKNKKCQIFFDRQAAYMYKLVMKNCTDKVMVNFQQTYDPSWKLYNMNSKKIFDGQISPEGLRNVRDSFYFDKMKTLNLWDIMSLKDTAEARHYKINGFANAWLMDVEQECRNNDCVKNDDGTYNTSFVILYEKQLRYFQLLIISGVTFVLSILMYGLLTLIKVGKK